jgi:GH15 family glucan-1,4-alpha-glucosidase
MLSDRKTAALVDRAGDVVWWCPDRFDRDAWFSSLLGDAGGSWLLRPREITSTQRAYLPDTLVIRTTFHTRTGTALEDTVLAWESWTRLHDRPTGFAADQIAIGARVIQRLTHQDTGAIIASPVTSLPEILGGDSNWDYRYAWLRDSSLVLNALRSAMCDDEAKRYFCWLAGAALDGDPEADTRALFGCDGERLLHEIELDCLGGFGDSAPVRVGNAAFAQRQLDVYGHILDAAATYAELDEYDSQLETFLCQSASRAARGWRQADSGIWEERSKERHHTSSQLMCWLVLERACALSDSLGPGADPAHWRRERDAIARSLESEAWNEARGVFVSTLGGDQIDASALLFVTSGFLPADDEPGRRLVDAVESELSDDGLLRRWPGAEDGAFLLCSFWLSEALALTGRVERAQEVFERAQEVFERAGSCANDLGLLPEEIDPESGEARRNTPLALSHTGLVRAASVLDSARAEA